VNTTNELQKIDRKSRKLLGKTFNIKRRRELADATLGLIQRHGAVQERASNLVRISPIRSYLGETSASYLGVS
jgi:hypothetical protein